jgi:hypothetical protein
MIRAFDGDLCFFRFAGNEGFHDHFDSARQSGIRFLIHSLSFLVRSETLPPLRWHLVPLWLFARRFFNSGFRDPICIMILNRTKCMENFGLLRTWFWQSLLI